MVGLDLARREIVMRASPQLAGGLDDNPVVIEPDAIFCAANTDCKSTPWTAKR